MFDALNIKAILLFNYIVFLIYKEPNCMLLGRSYIKILVMSVFLSWSSFSLATDTIILNQIDSLISENQLDKAISLLKEEQGKSGSSVLQQSVIFEKLGDAYLKKAELKQSISFYRLAVIRQLEAGKVESNNLPNVLAPFMSAYEKIGIFSIKEDQFKDEALLRLLADQVKHDRSPLAMELVHGMMLYYGDKRFGNESDGVSYSSLRYDAEKPVCNLVANEPSDPAARKGYQEAKAMCDKRISFYQKNQKYITPELKEYRKFETDFFNDMMRQDLP